MADDCNRALRALDRVQSVIDQERKQIEAYRAFLNDPQYAESLANREFQAEKADAIGKAGTADALASDP